MMFLPHSPSGLSYIARLLVDPARIAELENQKDAFSTEIESATGLGGRRREKSDPERVRKNVSNAVASAIAQDLRTPAETRNANDSRTQFSEISSTQTAYITRVS